MVAGDASTTIRRPDDPTTPWQRVRDAGILTDNQIANVATRIEGVNPADLTRQINQIQTRLTKTARATTEALTTAKTLDLESLQPSINRLAPAKCKPSRAQHV